MTKPQTVVSIQGDRFLVNGRPTNPGAHNQGVSVEGLLLNSRMVQGIFDDRNPETRARWDYPDGPWDADRNTDEFVTAMSGWSEHGLNAITINLQGGSPFGYSKEQPWINSAFDRQGNLLPAYMARLTRILERADELGMVVILGLFYFGQMTLFESDAEIRAAVDNAVNWIVDRGYGHVLLEIGNEVDITRTPNGYGETLVSAPRVHELVVRAQKLSQDRIDTPAGRLLVSTSLKGRSLPGETLLAVMDYVLLHGNGVSDPDDIATMVRQCRGHEAYRGQPLLFNEDDHYDFHLPDNNMMASVSEGAGWGFFDYRRPSEDWREGFQSVPADWSIGSERKRAFFDLVRKLTGAR